MPISARFRISCQAETECPRPSSMLWLKLSPFKLKAIVLTPSAVSQMPVTGGDLEPKSQEEVQRAGIVKGGKLEDETTKIAVRGRDAVGFVFLPESA